MNTSLTVYKFICPKCGEEVQSRILMSNPPQTQNACFKCGWRGKRRIKSINTTGKYIPKIIAD